MKIEHAFWRSVGVAGVVVFFLGVAVGQGLAGIIPSDRFCDWSYAGVPGGIPYRTNIFVNLLTTTNPLYKCYGDGVHDDSTALANAIGACPSNEVIYAPSATYLLTNAYNYASFSYWQWTLRGDGMGKTVFVDDAPYTLINLGGGQWQPATNQTANILSGAVKGSTNIVIDAAIPYLTPGWCLLVDQLNDNTNVSKLGYFSSGSSDRLHDGTRVLSQMTIIQSVVNGTNITFSPPLNFTMNTNLLPQATTYWAGPVQGVGFEDFTITNVNPGNQDMIDLSSASGCWARNVEFANVVGHDMLWSQCVQCQIQDCYLHGGYSFTVGNGYGLVFYGAWNCLVQNSIFYGLYDSLTVEIGNGCVVGYNYISHTVSYPTNYMICGMNLNHLGYSCLLLAEGNVVNEIQADFSYGTSGLLTLYRNWCLGNDYGINSNQKPISLDCWSLSNNIVGNVLGSPGLSWTYMETNTVDFVSPTIYRLGYPAIGNNHYINATNAPYLDLANSTNDLDTRVVSTAFIEGNYDFANNATVWTNAGTVFPQGMAPTNLPASLYLSSQPSWWSNSVPWPPIGPDVSVLTNPIPAQLRFYAIQGAVVTPIFALKVNGGTGSGIFTTNRVVAISTNAPGFISWSGMTNYLANPALASTTVKLSTNVTVTANYSGGGGLSTNGVGTETPSPPLRLTVSASTVQASGGAGSGGTTYTAKDYYTNTLSSGIQFESFWDGSDRLVGSGHFTASSSYTLTRVDIPLSPAGTPTGNIRAHIYADSSGSLGSSLGTVSAWTPASQSGFVQFTNLAVTVVSGTAYWIVLETDVTRGDGVNYQTWNYSFDAGNGPIWKSSDGASWSLVSNNTRGNFITYSSP
jgi:hypothetical protein